MADIELVIKIPEGIYRRATRDYLEIVDLRDIRLAIINGKPLIGEISCDKCKHKRKKYKRFPCVDCLDKDRFESEVSK